jgi:hypothetical protein
MAKTIPQLTDATSVGPADELIIQQGGITKRATATELATGLNTINGTINVRDFGAVGDGVTDDTAAIQAAIDSLGVSGGRVELGNGKFLIDSTLTVKASVSLIGPHEFVGSPGSNSSAPYGNMGGAIIVNSAATISLQSGATVSGVLIYRKGMTFPAANSSAFAGTAITYSGDDCSVSSCQIMGFEFAVFSNDRQRPRMSDLNIDCQNGIRVSLCYDVPKIINIHCWPFSTIANSGFPSAEWYQRQWRTGAGFSIRDTVDAPMMVNCFAYAYATGFHFKNVAMVSITNCIADNSPISVVSRPSSIGFHFEGFINGCLAAGCTVYSHENGIKCQLASSFTQLSINNFFLADQEFAAIVVDEGIVDVTDVSFLQSVNGLTRYGIYVTSASVDLRTDFCTFTQVSNPIHTTTATNDILIGPSIINMTSVTSMTSGTMLSRPIFAASDLALPGYGTTYRVSGATNINTVSNGWAGREVTLTFQDALTVANATGTINSVRLNGAVNFAVTVNSSLTLRHNGVQWFEVGRCL